jgi:hypothetical protein
MSGVVVASRSERGTGLVLALLFVVLTAAIVAAVTLASRTESLVAVQFRAGREALYAAEGAIWLALRDLSAQADWDSVLTGAVAGSFTDGASIGSRRLPGGETVVLCCGPGSLTGGVQLRADNGRSWGADTPQWVLFSWGPIAGWLPAGRIQSPLFVAVWVSDDPGDGDGNPTADNNDVLQLHAHALGTSGGRRVVEALVHRPGLGDPAAPAPAVRVVRWREVRW